MRALLSVLQQVDVETTSGIFFENASYTVLELIGESWSLVAINQIPGQDGLPESLSTKKTGLPID
jgi:hypothetical protein